MLIEEEPLRAEEVAELLHIGRNTVYALAKSGELASYRVGRKLLFMRRDVEGYLRAQRSGANVPDGGDSDLPASSYAVPVPLPERQRVRLAGTGAPAGILAEMLGRVDFNVSCIDEGPYQALVHLYFDKADAVLIDLFDARSDSCNLAYVRALAPGLPVVALRLGSRDAGLLVAQGNPLGLHSWGGLLREGVRLVNRPSGSAERILLDERLSEMEARPESICGYGDIAASGMEAAHLVARGLADACVGYRDDAACEPGVSFVPLQRNHTDLVLHKSVKARGLVAAGKRMVATADFKRRMSALGYGTAQTGALVYES